MRSRSYTPRTLCLYEAEVQVCGNNVDWLSAATCNGYLIVNGYNLWLCREVIL